MSPILLTNLAINLHIVLELLLIDFRQVQSVSLQYSFNLYPNHLSILFALSESLSSHYSYLSNTYISFLITRVLFFDFDQFCSILFFHRNQFQFIQALRKTSTWFFLTYYCWKPLWPSLAQNFCRRVHFCSLLLWRIRYVLIFIFLLWKIF